MLGGQTDPPPNTPSATTQTAAAQQASPNWQNQVAGALAGSYAPAMAQSGLTQSLGNAQLQLDPYQLQVQQSESQNTQGYDMAQALLGYEGTGLQSQGLASQMATAAGQQGIEQGEYGIQQTAFPEQQAQAKQQFETAQQGLQDQGAASGILNTQGQHTNEANLKSNYGWQTADIYRQQQLAQAAQQSEQLGYGGQQEQMANAQQQLKLAAQGQGLSVQQATNQFGFGLQQLGVNAEPEQYVQGIANAQGAGAQQLAAYGSQAALIGGLGPNFLTQGS